MGFASPIPKWGRRQKVDPYSVVVSQAPFQQPVSIATRETCREVMLTVGSCQRPTILLGPDAQVDHN